MWKSRYGQNSKKKKSKLDPPIYVDENAPGNVVLKHLTDHQKESIHRDANLLRPVLTFFKSELVVSDLNSPSMEKSINTMGFPPKEIVFGKKDEKKDDLKKTISSVFIPMEHTSNMLVKGFDFQKLSQKVVADVENDLEATDVIIRDFQEKAELFKKQLMELCDEQKALFEGMVRGRVPVIEDRVKLWKQLQEKRTRDDFTVKEETDFTPLLTNCYDVFEIIFSFLPVDDLFNHVATSCVFFNNVIYQKLQVHMRVTLNQFQKFDLAEVFKGMRVKEITLVNQRQANQSGWGYPQSWGNNSWGISTRKNPEDVMEWQGEVKKFYGIGLTNLNNLKKIDVRCSDIYITPLSLLSSQVDDDPWSDFTPRPRNRNRNRNNNNNNNHNWERFVPRRGRGMRGDRMGGFERPGEPFQDFAGVKKKDLPKKKETVTEKRAEERFVEFLCKCPNLESLGFQYFKFPVDSAGKIVESCPMLKELKVKSLQISKGGASGYNSGIFKTKQLPHNFLGGVKKSGNDREMEVPGEEPKKVVNLRASSKLPKELEQFYLLLDKLRDRIVSFKLGDATLQPAGQNYVNQPQYETVMTQRNECLMYLYDTFFTFPKIRKLHIPYFLYSTNFRDLWVECLLQSGMKKLVLSVKDDFVFRSAPKTRDYETPEELATRAAKFKVIQTTNEDSFKQFLRKMKPFTDKGNRFVIDMSNQPGRGGGERVSGDLFVDIIQVPGVELKTTMNLGIYNPSSAAFLPGKSTVENMNQKIEMEKRMRAQKDWRGVMAAKLSSSNISIRKLFCPHELVFQSDFLNSLLMKSGGNQFINTLSLSCHQERIEKLFIQIFPMLMYSNNIKTLEIRTSRLEVQFKPKIIRSSSFGRKQPDETVYSRGSPLPIVTKMFIFLMRQLISANKKNFENIIIREICGKYYHSRRGRWGFSGDRIVLGGDLPEVLSEYSVACKSDIDSFFEVLKKNDHVKEIIIDFPSTEDGIDNWMFTKRAQEVLREKKI